MAVRKEPSTDEMEILLDLFPVVFSDADEKAEKRDVGCGVSIDAYDMRENVPVPVGEVAESTSLQVNTDSASESLKFADDNAQEDRLVLLRIERRDGPPR